MELDLFTFSAQVINFIILVALLNRFLFKPVIKAVDEREKRMADLSVEAARKLDEAARLESQNLELLQKNRAGTESLMAAAKREADESRQRLISTAKSDSDTMRAAYERSISDDRSALTGLMLKKSAELATQAAAKALIDLAESSLDEKITLKFLSMIGSMDDAARKALKTALEKSADGVIVACSYEIVAAYKDKIIDSIRLASGYSGNVIFENDAFIHGIELRAGGYKTSWTFEGFTSAMEAIINPVFENITGGKKSG